MAALTNWVVPSMTAATSEGSEGSCQGWCSRKVRGLRVQAAAAVDAGQLERCQLAEEHLLAGKLPQACSPTSCNQG